MSTDLYGVRILTRDEGSFVARVSPLAREVQGHFWDPFDPVPFFELLAEPRSGGPGARPALRERSSDRHESSVEDATRLILRAEIVDIARLLAPMDADFHYEVDGQWLGEDSLPQVTYRVWVADAAETAHLLPGAGWGSTCSSPYRRRSAIATPEALDALDALFTALDAGGTRGPGAVDQLRGALRLATGHRGDWYTWRACEALGRLGATARAAAPDLARLIRDPGVDVSGYAAEALGLLARGDASVARWVAIEHARRVLADERSGLLLSLSTIGARDEGLGRFLDDLDVVAPHPRPEERVQREWARFRCTGDPAAFHRATAGFREPFEMESEDCLFLVLLPNERASDAEKRALLPMLAAFLARYRGPHREVVLDFLQRWCAHLPEAAAILAEET
ncbi:MAG: hypothetical protein J0L92_14105 [Deltaproteobacteria bacterium]|nr:hypothetical protein [Deltaproteobacteria bacterium]